MTELHPQRPGLLARAAAILAIAGVATLAAILVTGPADPAIGQTPRGAIENLTLTSENPGELTISWDLPDPEPSDYRISWAEESLGYLSFRATNVADRGNNYPTGATTSITLTGLTEGATFKVRMRARYTSGGNGDGPWSGPWSTVTTGTVSVTPEPQTPETNTPDVDPNSDPVTDPVTDPVIVPDEDPVVEPVIVPDADPVTQTSTDTTIPAITTPNAVSVAEGITGLFNFSANDSDTHANDLTWTLTGGADQSHFTLSTSGALTFKQAKDYETPDDAGADRIYDITVQVSDGTNNTSADFTVTLTDVDEGTTAPPAPAAPTVFDAGKSGLTVSWVAPTHTASTITGYDLQYREIDEVAWTDGPQDVTETSKKIDGLLPDVNYHVRVRAQDSSLSGPWSEFGMGTTALWKGVMVVERFDDTEERGFWGYDRRPNGHGLGSLAPNSFTYDSTEYEIVMLARHIGERRMDGRLFRRAVDLMTHDRAVPNDWVLRFGQRRFFVNQAMTGRVATNRPQFLTLWTNPPDLGLIPHFQIEASISRDPTRSTHGAGDVTLDAEVQVEGSVGGSSGSDGGGGGSVPRSQQSGPQEVTDVKAEVTHNQVTLRWTAPDRNDISGYRIKRGIDTGHLVVHVDDTETTDSTFVDTQVGQGTRYTYSVQPILDSPPTDSTPTKGGKSLPRTAKSHLTENLGQESSHVPVLTLLGDPNAKRQGSNLVELPKNSRGEYILPVSREGSSYRHSWISERLRSHITYSVNLEAHATYRVSLWDFEYFDHHLQAGPGASIGGLHDFIDHDSDYLLADFMHGTAHGSPYEYHVELESITIGGLEGRGIPYVRSVPGAVSSLRDLSRLVADGATQSYVFQADVADDHTLRIDALTAGVRYQIRIEKLDDHPDGPSALHRLSLQSSYAGGRGGSASILRYDGYTYGGISPGDQDWFVISLDANKRYAFSLHGGRDWRNLNSPDFVGLAGPNGVIMPWSTARTTFLSLMAEVTGDYYIGVQSAASNGSGMYIIYAEEYDAPPGVGTDVKLPVSDEWYTSFYQTPHDYDAYKVDLKANRRYYVALTKGIGGSTDSFQWSRRHNIDAVCQPARCSRSASSRDQFLDHYRDVPFDDPGTPPNNDNEDLYSARGIAWTLGWDSDMMEFSPKTDGEYIIIVTNVGASGAVSMGGYKLKIVDYGPDS